MKRILFALLFIVAIVGTAKSAEVLWFPFDEPMTMTCEFGDGCYPDHEGVDFRCPEGTNLYAAMGGIVIAVTNNVPGQLCNPMNFGNYVKIQNDQGDMQTIHGHMLMGSVVVSVGQRVNPGQYLGQSSNSGSTYNSQGQCGQGGGYHLHLEIRVLINGVWTPVDPYTYDGGLWTDPLQYGSADPPIYLCQYNSQSPSGVTDKYPGETFTCEVQYWNRGNTTWDNVPPTGYVELKAVHQDGTLDPSSFLYHPSWLNSQSPATMQQALVTPDQSATFSFTGQVPLDASPGLHYAWFRPNHSDAVPSLLNDWGGMCFQINVLQGSDPTPYPDAIVAVPRSSTQEQWYGCPSTGSSFGTQSELINDFGDSGNIFLSGDVDGDVFDDFLTGKIINSTTVEWRLATAEGNGKLTSRGVVLSDFGDENTVFLAGDFNGDGKCDLAGGTPEGSTTVKWRVALSTGHDLASDGIWTDDFGNPGFRFFAGDVNHDHKCDLINNNDGTSSVTWRHALSNGNGFGNSTTAKTTPKSSSQKFQVGDYSGDSKCDLAYSVRTSANVIAWWVCRKTDSGYSDPTRWNDDIGQDNSRYISRDMNNDGRCDLVAITPNPTNMEWRVARSTGTVFNATTVWKSSFGTTSTLTFVANVFPTSSGKRGTDDPEIADDLPVQVQSTLASPLDIRIVPNPTTGPTQFWMDNFSAPVISFQIFDIQGRLIRSLTDLPAVPPWSFSWDGRNKQNQRIPTGIYYLRFATQNEVVTRRITVIR